MEEMLVESAPSQPDFTNESQNGQEAFSNEKEKVITVLVKVDEDDKNGESRPLVLTDEKIKFLQELMGSMVLGSLNGGKEKHSDKSYKKEDTTCWECGGNGHIKSECPTFIRRNKNELSSKQSGNRDQMRNIAGSKYGAGIRRPSQAFAVKKYGGPNQYKQKISHPRNVRNGSESKQIWKKKEE
jgi:hypothetical protein